jgi:hypothetical protein
MVSALQPLPNLLRESDLGALLNVLLPVLVALRDHFKDDVLSKGVDDLVN